MALKTLDETRAAAVEALCELIVPGSGRVGPVVYIDATLAGMPAGMRGFAIAVGLYPAGRMFLSWAGAARSPNPPRRAG